MRILTGFTLAIAVIGALVPNAEQRSVKAEPIEVCRLQADPPAYNRKVVEVSGLVSHGFEHFTISDAKCSPSTVWLDYGGAVNSDTVFCCGTTAGAPRGGTLVVEGVTLPLRDDAMFRRFDDRIRKGGTSSDVTFRATLRGRFFAGEKHRPAGGRESWGGYGHFGCCSLLVIQQVLAVDGNVVQSTSDLREGGRAPASLPPR